MGEARRRAEGELVKSKAAQDIVNVLINAGLTVSEGAEILIACNNLIKERTFSAMTEEEARPLSEALSHLNKSDIKIVGSLQ